MDPYVEWLHAREPRNLFTAAGTWWRTYQKAVVQASLKPEPARLQKSEAQDLLHKSGGLFVRYFTRTSGEPTAFWYTACAKYDFNELSGKARNQIRRAYKNCEARKITAEWLAANAYECYAAAFTRHGRAPYRTREKFRNDCVTDASGPFEFWGVFVGENLAGFTKCAVGEGYAAMVLGKFDPRYLPQYPAYALMDTMLAEYVARQEKLVTNGFRSIVHETNMQEFLEKFGFCKVYCDLRVIYRPLVRLCVSLLLPLRRAIDRVERPPLAANVKALLAQERIRRSFS